MGAGLDGDNEVADDTEAVNGEKHQVEPLKLGFVVQPGAVRPNDAKRHRQEHGQWVEVEDDGQRVGKSQHQSRIF
jgi:hypothetical protein